MFCTGYDKNVFMLIIIVCKGGLYFETRGYTEAEKARPYHEGKLS